MLDFVESSMSKVSGQQSSTCRAKEQTAAIDVSSTGVPLPYPLSDQRPLPDTLPSSLLATEGASAYFVWKTLLNFNLWAGCAATNTPHTVTPGVPVTGDSDKDLLLAKGWAVHSTHWQPDGAGTEHNGLYWPFAAVLHKAGYVIIVVRGTQTQQDVMSDFNYNTSTAGLQPGQPALNLPGNVHQGFAAIATSLWPGVQAALQELLASPAGVSNVYVAGHSLGAGVATLLSYGMQTCLQQHEGPQVKLAALLMAPPNAGNAAFAAQFNKAVNARRLPFSFDVIPQVPCSPSMVGCADATVPTGTYQNDGLWQYSPVGGTIPLEAARMPQQAAVWGLLKQIHPCQMKRFFEATHVCSYNCYMSQFVGDANNMCRLWGKDTKEGSTGIGGTFCSGFPATEGRYQYPYLL
ncbi:hypothetical protein OEZ86_009064 [Tetradesmus obliquus]|nr:hypothetical protein OEZ86_009064 [Tetradesmus obliquus]